MTTPCAFCGSPVNVPPYRARHRLHYCSRSCQSSGNECRTPLPAVLPISEAELSTWIGAAVNQSTRYKRDRPLDHWLDLETLISDAIYSLVTCLRNYDSALGVRWSTYAISAIRNALNDSWTRQSRESGARRVSLEGLEEFGVASEVCVEGEVIARLEVEEALALIGTAAPSARLRLEGRSWDEVGALLGEPMRRARGRYEKAVARVRREAA